MSSQDLHHVIGMTQGKDGKFSSEMELSDAEVIAQEKREFALSRKVKALVAVSIMCIVGAVATVAYVLTAEAAPPGYSGPSSNLSRENAGQTRAVTLKFKAINIPKGAKLVRVVGSEQYLGNWDPCAAPILAYQGCDNNGAWTTSLSLNTIVNFEYKLFIQSEDQCDHPRNLGFESGPNDIFVRDGYQFGDFVIANYLAQDDNSGQGSREFTIDLQGAPIPGDGHVVKVVGSVPEIAEWNPCDDSVLNVMVRTDNTGPTSDWKVTVRLPRVDVRYKVITYPTGFCGSATWMSGDDRIAAADATSAMVFW